MVPANANGKEVIPPFKKTRMSDIMFFKESSIIYTLTFLKSLNKMNYPLVFVQT